MEIICKILAILMSLTIGTSSVATVKTTEKKADEKQMAICSDYVIVRGENASPSEANAANILKNYLKEISGIDFKLVTDSTPETAKEIIVGKTNREGNGYTIDRTALGDEGIAFKTVGEKVVIAGGEKRGTLYAVYEFLIKYFDCRWYTYEVKVVPKKDVLLIPAELDYTYVPVFEYRETDWISPRYTEYSIANHLNANSYRYLSPENGGTFGYANSFAHTMASLIPTWYFNSNPEMFALGVENGERTIDQPCLTNPKTLEVAIESCRNILRSNPNGIVCITQNDNRNYCVCENCKKIDAEEGGQAGTMIRFVNAISNALTPEFPNAVFDTFAYQYTRKAPKISVPNPNVIVRICSIECCFAHSLNDTKCKENVSFHNDILDWQKICKRIYVWDYTTNYSNYNGPFCDFGVLQDNMKFFVENNVKGIYEEGNYTASASNGEFAELRAYLLSRLLWDQDINYDEEMLGFCKAYYGDKAGEYVKQYVDMTTEKTGNRYFFKTLHMGIYSKMTDKGVLKLNIFDIHKMTELFNKAKGCAENETFLKRIELSEISWRYWKSCNRVCEFSKFRFVIKSAEANRQLYKDMVRLGISIICEGDGGLLTDDPNFFGSPREWTK